VGCTSGLEEKKRVAEDAMTPDKLEGWPPDEQAPRASEPNLDPQAPALALWAHSTELSQADDRERRRLADILHEDLQQHLSAMKFHLAAMKSRAKADPAQQAIIAQLDRMLLEAIEKSSGVSHDLSPATLALPDLAQTFRWLADRHQSRYRLRVHVTGGAEIEPGALKSFLYKVGRELLFNVVKHADVTDARLRLRRLGPYISLTVSDQGRGFILETLHDTAGFGLLRIREQVTLLGGRLTIRTAPGAGTRLRITLPVAP
jgi:signal transduction histidine kinase